MNSYEAMSKKTAIIQLAKYLPKSIEFQKAIILDELSNKEIPQELDIKNIDEAGEIKINDGELFSNNNGVN